MRVSSSDGMMELKKAERKIESCGDVEIKDKRSIKRIGVRANNRRAMASLLIPKNTFTDTHIIYTVCEVFSK